MKSDCISGRFDRTLSTDLPPFIFGGVYSLCDRKRFTRHNVYVHSRHIGDLLRKTRIIIDVSNLVGKFVFAEKTGVRGISHYPRC